MEQSKSNKETPYQNLGVTAKLLPALMANDGNFCFSPFGISSVLLALGLGSSGETRSQIFEVLEIPNKAQPIRQKRIDFRDLHWGISDFRSYLALSTSKGDLNPKYKDALSKDLGVVFLKHSLDAVNKWAIKQEEGRFGYPLGFLPPSSDALFINMVSLRLNALQPANTVGSEVGQFLVGEDLLTKVTYSELKSDGVYFRADSFDCILLHDIHNKLKTYVLLPNNNVTINELIKSLNERFLERLFREVDLLPRYPIKIKIPDFYIKSSLSLRNGAHNLELGLIFNGTTANFPKIRSSSFWLDDLQQTSLFYINSSLDQLDESNNTSNSSVGGWIKKIGGGLKTQSLQPMPLASYVASLDRPFLCFALDDKFNNVLMVVKVVNPKAK